MKGTFEGLAEGPDPHLAASPGKLPHWLHEQPSQAGSKHHQAGPHTLPATTAVARVTSTPNPKVQLPAEHLRAAVIALCFVAGVMLFALADLREARASQSDEVLAAVITQASPSIASAQSGVSDTNPNPPATPTPLAFPSPASVAADMSPMPPLLVPGSYSTIGNQRVLGDGILHESPAGPPDLYAVRPWDRVIVLGNDVLVDGQAWVPVQSTRPGYEHESGWIRKADLRTAWFEPRTAGIDGVTTSLTLRCDPGGRPIGTVPVGTRFQKLGLTTQVDDLHYSLIRTDQGALGWVATYWAQPVPSQR